ncbi:hypothetical protein NQ314_001150 [Rhamnusium bicolor]|uniref:Structural maintenance of chromosomes protein n=1 Tax=Rhamnusium bicolor TaxID=1586634 RepID=A0AAV8ZVV8_9CUCU|nr:hypothetical protein NQ314_001150 [Rhamnusium bicolor]
MVNQNQAVLAVKRKLVEDVTEFHNAGNVNDNDNPEDNVTFSDDESTIVDGIRIPAAIKPTCSFDPTGPRLIITKIVNNYFKSYADEQTLGPFHKCFNAIVGPNGSGKSNSGDDYDIVPGSEFVVARTANKDNSSYYQLNGRKVQFKEVGTLLKKHGIDLDHNRFLILQGEVEQIAMMKCKAENEHESAEQRTEKLNRLRLVEKELNELKAPMEEAVGFLKTENTIVYSKNFLYQKNVCELESKLEKAEENRNEVLEVQKVFIENLKKLREGKAEKDKILKQQSERYENLQKRKDSLTEAFNKANNKDIQLQETMTQMNKTRKKTKEMIIEEKKKLEKLERVPEESRMGIEECEVKEAEMLVKKEKFDAEKTKILASLRTETKALQEKKGRNANRSGLNRKSETFSLSQFTLAESELKIYVSNEENEKSKFENLRNVYETAQATIEERTKQVALLKKKIPATEKSLGGATDELNAVKQKEAQIINDVRRKKAHLEERRNSMQASRSQGKVLDSLMQQKREGNCPGLYGRLGDLGAIDQKYDVAISTACGPLDNIVVDTSNFIALDKQEHLRDLANSKIRTPENVHRLFDLVRIQDEDVRTAFYYALRDTLVANDLEQASRIAYGVQRFRVVTLGGDLIETTGTMSGGGKTVSKGRMGQSVRVSNVDPRELENMEERVQQMEQQVRELRQKQASLESQINTLQPEFRQMKFDYEKFTMELEGLQQQQPRLAKQLKEQEAKSKVTKADPVQEATETAGALQAEVDEITKEIKEKTTGKMKAIDKNINDVTKTIDKCKAEITRNAKKCAEKITTMEQDVADMENKLRQMKEERTEIEQDAAKLLTCVEEITEVAELTKEENKLKSDKVDVDEKVKTCEHKLNEYKGAIHQLEVKMTRLKLQDIPNESIEELKKFTHEELEQRNIESVEKELQAAESHLKAAKPNLNAIQEYRKKQSIYVDRSKELEEITVKRSEMRKLFDNLRTQRKEEFLTGYNIIKLKLKEMYQMITLGGDADFEMVDTYDPFTEGIQFNVRPPKKSWKKISNLSGGEKTLSSLALVFALHYYKPSPLYVMDEIDAALDFKNVSIVGHYIKERTKNAQFVIISLRSNMFELCDNLVGIYKTYNCTKTITIDPRVYDNKEQAVPTTNTNNNMHVVDNVCSEKEKDNNIERNEKNVENVNLDLSKTTPSTDKDGTTVMSTSDLTESSNMNSEDADMFSGESQDQSDKIIDASFQPEEMEVDS